MSDEREQRELEGRIRELEATVESLTTELVDATERIRELEAALDAADGVDATTLADTSNGAAASQPDERPSTDWVPASRDVEEEAAEEESEETTETEEHETLGDRDDIIVA